jgi:Uncharacterized conserved protein (DUF2190)
MADYTPAQGSPAALSYTAGAAITGGQVVKISAADTVTPSAANDPSPVGVAGHNAALNQKVTVLCGSGVIHETPSTGGIAVAAPVYASTGGAVSAAGTGAPAIGVAVRAAAGGRCRWLSFR